MLYNAADSPLDRAADADGRLQQLLQAQSRKTPRSTARLDALRATASDDARRDAVRGLACMCLLFDTILIDQTCAIAINRVSERLLIAPAPSGGARSATAARGWERLLQRKAQRLRAGLRGAGASVQNQTGKVDGE